jgi:hypothetical protein
LEMIAEVRGGLIISSEKPINAITSKQKN